MRKRRTYNPRLVKASLSYTVQEIAELFGLHPNAVRRWVKNEKLPLIDKGKPHLVNGADLIVFLSNRRKSRRKKCKTDEFYCLCCHDPRRAAMGSISHTDITANKIQIHAVCASCGSKIKRIGNAMQLQNFQKIYCPPAQLEQHITDSNQPSLNCHLPMEEHNA